MQSYKPSVKQKRTLPINPLENLSEGIKQTGAILQNETQEAVRTAWKQLLGVDKYKTKKNSSSLEMKAGEDYSLPKRRKEHLRPGIDYHREIRDAGTRLSERQSVEIRQEIQEIMIELQRLSSASAVLEKAVVEATGQSMVKPGKYQLHFFQWLLLDIRQARMKVEDAGVWMNTTHHKIGKKQGKSTGNYWDKVSKHGTKFMMSGERTQANNGA